MFLISGRAIRGDGYGRKIGFPTINLDRRNFLKLKKKPKFGIYSGSAKIFKSGKSYKAGLVIGPYDKKGLPKLEAHLLGFPFSRRPTSGNVEFIFKKFLRPFRRFRTPAVLRAQIQKDLKKC